MRRWFFRQLDAEAWEKEGLSPLNRVIAGAIILAVLLGILDTEVIVREAVPEFFYFSDILLGALFCMEYALRLWVVGENPRFAGIGGRIRYLLSPIALIDLIAILPFLLTVGGQDAFLLRFVRLLRLLTLAKFGRYSKALKNLSASLWGRRYELFMSLAAAFMVMLLAGCALYFTEGDRNPESFGSIPRALWWGIATVTKVGYGGAFPETVLGKMFAGLFAIAAVGVVALPTGIMAAALSSAFQKERQHPDGDAD